MSEELAEYYREHRIAIQERKQERLASADTEGWTKHTEYHYSRAFKTGRVDWWPSTAKAKYNGRMYYGNRKVGGLIGGLLKAEEEQ